MNTKMESLSRTLPKLWGNQIRMFGLDMTHRKFANPPRDKFQYQWTLVWLMPTKRSTTNNTKMKDKTTNKNNWQKQTIEIITTCKGWTVVPAFKNSEK